MITGGEIKSYANDVCHGPAVPDTLLCKFSDQQLQSYTYHQLGVY